MTHVVEQNNPSLSFRAKSLHNLNPQGLNYPMLDSSASDKSEKSIHLLTPQTTAVQGWSGILSWPLLIDQHLKLKCEGAAHLVVHMPADFAYACVEPMTALSGALLTYSQEQIDSSVFLNPQSVKTMSCEMEIV
ncbi:MAG: hypothetical protein EBT78_08995 [Betaproteobacteria bacterium]|nr:hypothetical protein [Betaproteobacteria bacterium]NBT67883.1 hypothetical protein [Betaproteobacteria bacterium]NBY09301.1 hypothetical protein [Betaproteobacteria bacterium]